ncbi:uncharacterized protein FIESC28_02033 [Fusarium coffeatum]|uniref:BZIP domain-containing protein n=1 Tax=Fusarium coffeatum TaxID=231269 RepID=A0A366S927_9HYPO|nr:uncharacterized protein FIESC28_02033 [Fusarium coffeatum]RBR25125.1 hypothetical protein FIESC28_02033 [Fusarium coffeatum]
MDEPNQDFGKKAQEFHDNFTLTTGQDDANIDPLLNDCPPDGSVPPDVSNPMDSHLFMTSGMWNPAINNPVGFYPPGMSGMAPTTLTTNPLQPNSPIQPLDTQSSPRTPSSEPLFGTSRTSSKSSVPSFNSADADAKPRRSSRPTTKAQPQPAAVEAKPPRRRRASKAPSIKEEVEDEEDEEDAGLDESDKRNKFLKRNRIAASKCRQKKKEWVSSLEDTRYGLEHENNVLHKQYNGLVDELSTIKNQLMQHASCNDANINQWLDNEARKFVQRIASQNQAQVQAQTRPHQNTGDCCDKHRRSSSVATSIPRSIESEINYDHMPDSMIQSGP